MSPQDVRITSFVQADDRSYLSASVETSTYANGSSQLQGITRTDGELVLGYDALGRRSFEYDSRDPMGSRRDYRYLPNGQLGEVSVQTAEGTQAGFAIRYDERGRPLLLSGRRPFPTGQDRYELFWDDADRLIAVNIVFSPPRFQGSPTGTLTSARWHYHYVGSMLVAATRELIGTAPEAGVKRFWVVADERGLVHRMIDEQGATFWQARWDASGWRTLIGEPQPEMWVPFGLPGQIVLGANVIYGNSNADRTVTWGTEALVVDSTDSSGSSTRPAIALNQWRTYDPLLGGFLQPDRADEEGRLAPEAYLLARGNSVNVSDPSGMNTTLPGAFEFDSNCDSRDRLALTNASALAIVKLVTCFRGFCGQPIGKRKWTHAVSTGKVSCPKLTDREGLPISKGAVQLGKNYYAAAKTYYADMMSEYYPGVISDYYGGRPECLAMIMAHEALHKSVMSDGGLLYKWEYNYSDAIGHAFPVQSWQTWYQRIFSVGTREMHENFVDDATARCFNCKHTGTGPGMRTITHGVTGGHLGQFEH